MRAVQMRRVTRLGAMAIFVFLCVVPEVLSQTTRATLIGTVTDPNGAIVPGATVTATNIATNITSTTKTNQEGTYTFTALASRRVHRLRGGHRLQAQCPDRHHPADCRNLATGYPARNWCGDRRGPRGQRGATGSEHLERAGPGDRLQADSVAPAQWPTLSAAHHADAGCDPCRVCRLRRESRGCRRAQRRPPQRERPAVVGQQLPARRRREQRAAQRVRQHHAAARGACRNSKCRRTTRPPSSACSAAPSST